MATQHATTGRTLGGGEWHGASFPLLLCPREFSAAQLLVPAAAAVVPELLDELEPPESEEPLELDEDELLELDGDEDELLELDELPSFLVEL
jgi:hypothetical protein